MPNRDSKLYLTEFKALVNELKGDCDKCKMDCRDRLQWLDSLVESLRFQLAKSLAMNRLLLQAADKVSDFKDIDKELALLTSKILKKEVGMGEDPPQTKGPSDGKEEKDLNEKLSNWN